MLICYMFRSIKDHHQSNIRTLLTHSQTSELHGYIHVYRSIIIITNTLDFQQY
jgi:hypothetical protein